MDNNIAVRDQYHLPLSKPEALLITLSQDNAKEILDVIAKANGVNETNPEKKLLTLENKLNQNYEAETLSKLFKHALDVNSEPSSVSFRKEALLKALKYGLNVEQTVSEEIFKNLNLDFNEVSEPDSTDDLALIGGEVKLDSSYRKRALAREMAMPEDPLISKNASQKTFISNMLAYLNQHISETGLSADENQVEDLISDLAEEITARSSS